MNDFRKRFATEKRPHVPFRQIWQMVPNALIEANVGVENAYPFVKHKICRSAFTTIYYILKHSAPNMNKIAKNVTKSKFEM